MSIYNPALLLSLCPNRKFIEESIVVQKHAYNTANDPLYRHFVYIYCIYVLQTYTFDEKQNQNLNKWEQEPERSKEME